MDWPVSFGRYRLEPRGGLLSGTRPVRLTPKALALLTFLVEHTGELVTKEELFSTIWPDVSVGDAALVTCIQELRKSLHDDARRPRFIETLHRRGYRFIAKTTAVGSIAQPSPRNAGLLSLPDRPSIAVLPFDDMSDGPDQEHFADGISDDLITGLARIRWLFVIARNSTFFYKGRASDVRQIARELGVRYVLEGSVRRTSERVRISAQLIDAMSGCHLWAERYDRKVTDIFAVQDEITRCVAGEVEPRLLAAEGIRAMARSAEDLGAWELVARAQTYFGRISRADFENASGLLEKAISCCPDYTPARGMLGHRMAFASHMGWIAREQGLRTAHEHARRAIALDQNDPWGHSALGYWAMMQRRTEESISAFRRAVELNPNSAAAHTNLSHIYAFAGSDREAIAHGEEAMRLSPLDPETAFFLGGIGVAHYMAGRFQDSARCATDALRLRPGFQGAQRLLAASLAQAGRIEEANACLAIARREHPALSIAWIKASVPYQTAELMERFLTGMRRAGLDGRRGGSARE